MTTGPEADPIRGWGHRFRITVADAFLVICLLVIGVALPTMVSAVAGSLEIPRNDDWSYRKLAIDLAQTGQFRLDGAASTMLIGQLLLVQPFLWLAGLQPSGFAAAGVVFAAAAVVATFAMARQILSPGRAALVAGLLAVFPGYLAYATSFMTDVPTLACEFGCLALGARAIRQRPVSLRWLVASMVLGSIGFSIRDFALAAPASVALAAVCAEPRRIRNWAIGVVVLAVFVVVHTWRSTLAGVIDDAPFTPGSIQRLIPALSTVAFVTSPAAILAWSRWRGRWRRIDLIIGAELGLAIVLEPLVTLLLNRSVPGVLLKNLTTQWGTPGPEFLIGGRPLLFSDSAWLAINVVAIAAVVVTTTVCAGIAGVLLRRWRHSPGTLIRQIGSPAGVLLAFTVSVGGGLFLYGLGFHLYDRYLWAVAVPLAALLLYVPDAPQAEQPTTVGRDRKTARMVTAGLFGGTLGVLSLLLLLNSHAFDAARWRAGERLIELGVPASEIDAGYEWVGYHAESNANAARPVQGLTWYEGWWKSFRPCGLVSSEPSSDPATRLLETTQYQLNLVAGPVETLYLYARGGPGCPVP
jgi:hypothetical protein